MKMEKLAYAAVIATGIVALTACEESVTNITEKAEVASVAKFKDLEKCKGDLIGSMAYASDSAKVYVCTTDGWVSMSGSDGKQGEKGEKGDPGEDGTSCTVKALKSGDGYKVLCGGDSVGVLLNGEDGEDGEDGDNGFDGRNGNDCSLTDNENGTVTVKCGNDSTTLYKAMCGKSPYDPKKNVCYDETLYPIGTEVPTGDCSDTDLWCKNKSSEYRVQTGFTSDENGAGYWYSYTDNAEGGRSQVTFPKEEDEYGSYGPTVEACEGFCGTITLNEGTLDNTKPYAGVAFNINMNEFESASQANISDWDGICITYTTTMAAKLIIAFSDAMDQRLGYNTPYTYLPKAATATEKCFKWSEFRQAPLATDLITGTEAAAQAAKIKFEIEGNDGSSADFNIIRLRKYSSLPKPSDPIYTTCMGMWCGQDEANTIYTSDTTESHWWFRTDAEDNGTSTFTWPVALDEDNSLAPVIESEYALSGSFTLSSGYEYPYTMLGFFLNDEDTTASYDIANWEGICISYKSTISIALQIVPSDEATLTEYNNYSATLAKSATKTTVNLPWTRFKQQSGWGNKIDQELALAQVNQIRLMFQGVAGTSADFAIYSIGKPNTCY